ncbi:diacylglycerol kinase family lipid kinase [Dehalobacter sp. DCM]|uniref:diacylglycerol/lipid kinase family protein n=1 Tax=Dehalobacter sp. DCM TaxID=2907827 RepID=UPI003081EFF2|nr:diacylglycerol kinase family lipid kinase [Dehalobacter sp. DCM]
MNQDTWFAVVNPRSANGRTQQLWPGYHRKIEQAGVKVVYAWTSGSGGGTEIAKQAFVEGYRRFIAVGGDGTVNEVLNGLIENDRVLADNIELAVFEQGTGGDLVRSLRPGLNKDLDSLISLLIEPQTVLADIGKVEYYDFQGNKAFRYFINASNIGIGAEAVEQANRRSKALGSKITYLRGAIATILTYKKSPVSVVTDQKDVWKGNTWGLMVCNGKYIGGGMHIAPNALIDDGYFDLVIIKDISRFNLITRFPKIYRGTHIYDRAVEIKRCRTITLETPKSLLFEIDGEIPGMSPIDYRIIPECLKIRI